MWQLVAKRKHQRVMRAVMETFYLVLLLATKVRIKVSVKVRWWGWPT
jgi:hypothetical protein